MKLYIQNETKIEFDEKLLEQIAKNYTNKDIEILIINDDKMRELNKTTRGIDKSTDVLSFPLEDLPHTPLGSMAINADMVIKTAVEFGHSIGHEFALMFIHSLLHLLGYDHEKDKGEMREMEEEIIKNFNLPKSLIQRVEE